MERAISTETDRCSGRLTVKDKNGKWVSIPREEWVTVDVQIDDDEYWYWRCGGTEERSRSGPRVERLKVYHSTSSRKITWKCFEITS
jgi:hypothetical protein